MNVQAGLLVKLFSRFVYQCVISGVATARVVLQREQPVAGFIRMRFAPMSETGAAVLGALVTLTPGSTVIDIDMQKRELLLHLLDARHADAAVATIRHEFERDIAQIFPEIHA